MLGLQKMIVSLSWTDISSSLRFSAYIAFCMFAVLNEPQLNLVTAVATSILQSGKLEVSVPHGVVLGIFSYHEISLGYFAARLPPPPLP